MEGHPRDANRIEPEIVLRKVPGRGEGSGGVAKNTLQKPTRSDIHTSRDHVPRELTPSELFEKVALDDAKQNRRLSAKLNGSPTLPLPPFKRVGESSPREVETRPTTRMRFIICTLGLASLAMSQMSRMVLNQSITQMVDPRMLAQKQDSAVSSDGSCPWPEEEIQLPQVDDGGLTTTLSPSTSASSIAEETTTQRPTTTTMDASDLARLAPGEQEKPAEPNSAGGEGPIKLTIEIQSEDDLPNLPNESESPPVKPGESRDPNSGGNLDELPDFMEHEGTTSQSVAGGGGDEPTERPSESRPAEDNTHVFEIVPEEEGDRPEGTTTPVPTTTRLPGGSGLANNNNNNNTHDHSKPTQQAFSRYPQYKWTMQQQNTLLGGFYYSYFVFMVLGGRMAEIYGAKYVLLLSVGGSALINLATPWMASTSFTLLVMSRVVMGAIQSGVFPGMYALIAKWLTMTEASIYAPLIKMNLRLGMVLGSLLPGLAEGWPNVFYMTGVLSAVWSLCWVAFATSDPADNRWVSRDELTHINRKKKKKPEPAVVDEVEMDARGLAATGQAVAVTVASAREQKAPRKSTPWVKILTAPSVIGLIIVKLTFNYALDFLAIELPSYLRYVHHASKETISAITGPMFGIQVVLIVFVGWLAKVAVQRRPLGLDKTGIRKLFQGLASFGLAATFFLLTFNDCNLTYVTVLLQIISLLSMFTAGGETMLPYDLSLEYPATIMAIANSVANLSGVTTTTLTGLVLGNQGGSNYRWNILIYLIAGANLLGGLAFTFLVKAEPIDFSDNAKTARRRRDGGDHETGKTTSEKVENK